MDLHHADLQSIPLRATTCIRDSITLAQVTNMYQEMSKQKHKWIYTDL